MNLTQLLPLLKALGIDPGHLAQPLEEAAFVRLLKASEPAAVADLEKHNLTLARAAGHGDTARQLIRSAMYQLLKHALAGILPHGFGANVAADFLRDQWDDAIIACVSPEFEPGQTTTEAVALIVQAMAEQAF